MTLTKTFKRSGLVTLAGLVLVLLAKAGIAKDPLIALGTIALVFGGSVFCVSLFRHVMRGLLWRVGSRLFVSYVLLCVPVVFIVLVVYIGVLLITGQLAARRVETALVRRENLLVETAKDLAPRLASQPDAGKRRALIEAQTAALAGDLPGLAWAFVPAGRPSEGSPEAVQLLAPWLKPPAGPLLGRKGDAMFFAAVQRTAGADLLLVLPVSVSLRRGLEKETGITVSFEGVMKIDRRKPGEPPTQGGGVTIQTPTESTHFKFEKRDDSAVTETAARPAGSGPLSGRWVTFPLLIAVIDWSSGAPVKDKPLLFLVRSSVRDEYHELFGHLRFGRSGFETGNLALKIMTLLAASTVAVGIVASLLTALLVFRIARATGRLSTGFAEVDRGNFAYRAKLRGKDQLGGLIAGFNTMVSHLQESVAARADKQALDRELETARLLQRRLLPPPDFALPGFEIAVDFRPAAAIGGDFYDFIVEDPDTLTVILADVSGHGLPTGIVMASAKASASALARTGASGVRLFELLDGEVRRTTDARTFVTLAHLRFRKRDGVVEYTNAGHLYPYRAEPDGSVTSLANPTRPLGLDLPVTFRTLTAPLLAGDLWVILSDGIVEAGAAGGDEPFGFARLERILAENRGTSAAALRDRILSSWRAYTGTDEPADDRTLIVLKAVEAPGPTASA